MPAQLQPNSKIQNTNLPGILLMAQSVVALPHISLPHLVFPNLINNLLITQEILIELILEVDMPFIIVLIMDLNNKMELKILHFFKNV